MVFNIVVHRIISTCLGGAEDIEPEHHPALDVLGDVAVRHPPSRVGRIEKDVHDVTGPYQNGVLLYQV
jgi:hypothetical protein